MNPPIDIVGAVVITRWSYGLLKETSPVLLDKSIDDEYKSAVKETIESEDDNLVSDLHIW